MVTEGVKFILSQLRGGKLALLDASTYLTKEEAIHLHWLKSFAKHGHLPNEETYLDRFNIPSGIPTDTPDIHFIELKNRYLSDVIQSSLLNLDLTNTDAVLQGINSLTHNILSNNGNENADLLFASDKLSIIEEYEDLKNTKGVDYISSTDQIIHDVFFGYHKAEFTLTVAREKTFKTWLLLYEAVKLDEWLKLNNIKKPVLFFSFELTKERCRRRAISIKLKLNYPQFTTGKLPPSEETRFKNSLKKFSSNIVFIDNVTTVAGMEEKIYHYEPAMFFADSLQFCEPKMQMDYKKISFLALGVKGLCKKYDIPCHATSHLIRGAGKIRDTSSSKDKLDEIANGSEWGRVCDIVRRLSTNIDLKARNQVEAEIIAGREMAEGFKVFFNTNLEKMNLGYESYRKLEPEFSDEDSENIDFDL